MDILVVGAGVLGSLYAAKLHAAGHHVTVLARGERLAEIRQRGLRLIDETTGESLAAPVAVTDHLGPADAYELVLVLVRKNQVASLLPMLAANRHTPNVLFMLNNAAGPREMLSALGRERVLFGFPGAGGQREQGVVRYRLVARVQPTLLGELDGRRTPRVERAAQALREAGFPVVVSDNIDAWLKTHVALVSPIANALYLAGGSNDRLARTPDGLLLMVRAVKEGLRVLRALAIPITPARYRLLAWLPEPLLLAVLRRAFDTPAAELVMARHANAARGEMRQLAAEFQSLVRAAGLPTPAIDALSAYLDPAQPVVPEGQAGLRVDWRGVWAALGFLAAALSLGLWLRKKR